MIKTPDWLAALESVSASETARFRDFLAAHTVQVVPVDGTPVSFCVCGTGAQTILTFAGGWGGIELLYETILGFEEQNRMVIVDITPFADPDSMARAVDHILDQEGIGRVVVMGQSLSGILAQLYFRCHPDRVRGLVLTNTLAPQVERCRTWARVLLKYIPFALMRPLMRRKLGRLGHMEQEIPPEVQERRRFANAMMAGMLDRSFTRERIGRLLELVWRFNEQGGYGADEFCAWPGRVLLVSSEDDPYHQDAVTLSSVLPAAEMYTLPTGFGHLAPQINREEFQAMIQSFIAGLAS